MVMVSPDAFACVGWYGVTQGQMQFDDLFIPPKPIRELREAVKGRKNVNVEIDVSVMPNFKVKVRLGGRIGRRASCEAVKNLLGLKRWRELMCFGPGFLSLQAKSVAAYKPVWNSKASGTRTKLSVWEPVKDLGVFQRNKVGFSPPCTLSRR